MPPDGYEGFNFSSVNYLKTSAPPSTFYARKHDGLIIYDSIASNETRQANICHFNDFALLPLLNDSNVNDNRTLILLTFDETETYTINNQIDAVLLGGASPDDARGTVDSTYHTHYSSLDRRGKLGSRTLSNVFSFVANATNYTNLDISGADIPLTNLTGNIPGPLNAEYYVPFTAPSTSAVGAGGGPVFVGPGVATNLTAANAAAPVNLTTKNETVLRSGPCVAATTSNSTTSGNKSGAVDAREGVVGATVLGALLAGIATLLLA
ncbi:hypothetical protein EI94DRAFT_1792456 [Lactarius quietus]|nr:hypothetical protein EI94DRAFT_1792456 [Lactarius quietus]